MYTAMFGFNGISLRDAFLNGVFGKPVYGGLLLGIMTFIIWLLPNPIELLQREHPALNIEGLVSNQNQTFAWRPALLFAGMLAILFVSSIISIPKGGEFLYFNF